MKKYLVIIEKTKTGFSAYSPDVEGCIATGKTKEEVEKRIHDAIEFHIDGLTQEGYKIPIPKSYSKYMVVAAFGSEWGLPHIFNLTPSLPAFPRKKRVAGPPRERVPISNREGR